MDESVRALHEAVWDYYAHHARTMPWRDDHSPYRVLVSELMLQQTGVARVMPKFEEFMTAFPNVTALAEAPLADVLKDWQGLGYNRRARFLHEAAKMVLREYGGIFPDTYAELVRLPGVGKNTAGALLAYAFDKPAVFVETNIRTVLFHHVFDDRDDIHDRELEDVLRAALPPDNVREWYWALMDYGTHLKKTRGGRLANSRHYVKQSPLKGSVREVRGQIVRVLTDGPLARPALMRAVTADDRFKAALDGLVRDGLVTDENGKVGLTGA